MGTVSLIVIILAVCCLVVAFYLFKLRQKTQKKNNTTKYPNLNSDPECAAENVQSFFNILYIVTSWI